MATLAATVGGVGIQAAQSASANRRQAEATAQAKKDAAAQRAANERAINAANQKSPDLGALYKANKLAGSGGVGSTMLTGSGGAPVSASLLGRATLLGG